VLRDGFDAAVRRIPEVTDELVNHFYFYCFDDDFGPFFIKFWLSSPCWPAVADCPGECDPDRLECVDDDQSGVTDCVAAAARRPSRLPD
jgi:hypothetical protein